MVRSAIEAYDFHTMFTALHTLLRGSTGRRFISTSGEDWLYCDGGDDMRRRATRTVLDRTFDCLVRWLAPILCFTAEEAWLARHGTSLGHVDGHGASVHLELFAEVPGAWHDPPLGARWAELRDLRRVVTGAIEVERAAKHIGSSLQADVELFVPEGLLSALRDVDLAELCITSSGTARAAAPPEGAFTLADVAGIGVIVDAGDGDALRALLAGLAGGRPGTPGTTTSAGKLRGSPRPAVPVPPRIPAETSRRPA